MTSTGNGASYFFLRTERRLPAETRGVSERAREKARTIRIAEQTVAAMDVHTSGSFSVSHPRTRATVDSTMSVSDPPMR